MLVVGLAPMASGAGLSNFRNGGSVFVVVCTEIHLVIYLVSLE